MAVFFFFNSEVEGSKGLSWVLYNHRRPVQAHRETFNSEKPWALVRGTTDVLVGEKIAEKKIGPKDAA
jgi:hypothetical protein